jgi:peptidoglycan/LPS O-acetylase OafA/YrhL
MEQLRENKIRFVDALRGIAIIGVLVIHCGQIGTNEYPALIQNIILNGAIGVQLFFVASAFTIFLTYGNRYDKETTPTTNFFIRRFFRIAPMYYFGIIYFLGQDGFGARYWLGDASNVSTWNILSNLLFVHSINPYWITSVVPGGWSIAVEVCFYCLVPLLFLRIRNLNQAFLFFLFTVLLRMVLQSSLQNFPLITSQRLWGEYLFFYPPSQFPVFACGVILYFLIRTTPAEWRVDPFVVFSLSVLFLVQFITQTSFIFPGHIRFAMAFVLLGYALSRKEFFILVNPVMIYIGKISYSMYLVHFAVLHWLTKFNYVDFAPSDIPYFPIVNYLLRFCCLVSVTVMMSACTYHLIEVPLQNIGKSIVRRRENATKRWASTKPSRAGSLQPQP